MRLAKIHLGSSLVTGTGGLKNPSPTRKMSSFEIYLERITSVTYADVDSAMGLSGGETAKLETVNSLLGCLGPVRWAENGC